MVRTFRRATAFISFVERRLGEYSAATLCRTRRRPKLDFRQLEGGASKAETLLAPMSKIMKTRELSLTLPFFGLYSQRVILLWCSAPVGVLPHNSLLPHGAVGFKPEPNILCTFFSRKFLEGCYMFLGGVLGAFWGNIV